LMDDTSASLDPRHDTTGRTGCEQARVSCRRLNLFKQAPNDLVAGEAVGGVAMPAVPDNEQLAVQDAAAVRGA